MYGELPENSDTIPTKPESRKGGIGVRFGSQRSIEQVRRISRVSNYNMEEIINYWGEGDEQVLRKSELKEAVRDMACKRRSSDKDFTALGIEDKVGRGWAIKKSNRKVSREAVLDEQDLQYHEGILDDDMLAGVYSITSDAAKREAQEKAEKLHDKLANDGK